MRDSVVVAGVTLTRAQFEEAKRKFEEPEYLLPDNHSKESQAFWGAAQAIGCRIAIRAFGNLRRNGLHVDNLCNPRIVKDNLGENVLVWDRE